jgi:hypothetical protein
MLDQYYTRNESMAEVFQKEYILERDEILCCMKGKE